MQEGGNERGWPSPSLAEHSQTELSEGQIAQGSVPALRLLVFTNSAENTPLSISFHKDFVCLGKKELIKAVKTQGLPGVASLPSPEVFKYRLHNRSVGTTSIPCERD